MLPFSAAKRWGLSTAGRGSFSYENHLFQRFYFTGIASCSGSFFPGKAFRKGSAPSAPSSLCVQRTAETAPCFGSPTPGRPYYTISFSIFQLPFIRFFSSAPLRSLLSIFFGKDCNIFLNFFKKFSSFVLAFSSLFFVSLIVFFLFF
jgi:hypothetical protein